MVLGIYSFPLDCSVYWCITVHSIFLWVFVFMWYQVQSLLFYFRFYLFESSLFYSWWIQIKILKPCFFFSKKKLLALLIFYFFLACILFVSAPIFSVSFLLFTLNFVFVAFLALWGIIQFENFLISGGRREFLWRSCSANSRSLLRGNFSICSCRFGVFIWGGECKIFLCQHFELTFWGLYSHLKNLSFHIRAHSITELILSC